MISQTMLTCHLNVWGFKERKMYCSTGSVLWLVLASVCVWSVYCIWSGRCWTRHAQASGCSSSISECRKLWIKEKNIWLCLSAAFCSRTFRLSRTFSPANCTAFFSLSLPASFLMNTDALLCTRSLLWRIRRSCLSTSHYTFCSVSKVTITAGHFIVSKSLPLISSSGFFRWQEERKEKRLIQ